MTSSLLFSVLGQIPDPSADAGGFLSFLLSAVVGRNWILLAAAVCVGLTYLLRTFGAKWVPFFATDRGGAVLVLVIGMLGGIGSALAEGKPWWAAILGGLGLAATSAGAFVIPKKLVAPTPAPAP